MNGLHIGPWTDCLWHSDLYDSEYTSGNYCGGIVLTLDRRLPYALVHYGDRITPY